MFDVQPSAYARQRQVPLEGSRLDLIFHDGTAFKGPSFGLDLYLRGDLKTYTSLTLAIMPGAEWHPWSGSGTVVPWSNGLGVWIKPGKLPQTFRIGDALFTVHAYDAATKDATISIERQAIGFRILPWQANLLVLLFGPKDLEVVDPNSLKH